MALLAFLNLNWRYTIKANRYWSITDEYLPPLSSASPDQRPLAPFYAAVEVHVYQTATLLGSINHGLSSRHHPPDGWVYAVRDGDAFLYIGKTTNSVWMHIGKHLRSDDPLGRAAPAEAPQSSLWRVEACNFGGEQGLAIVERELIRRYQPRLNGSHNTGRARTDVEQRQLELRDLIGPTCVWVIERGWPSFETIPLEVPRSRRRAG